jgi:hypothetical protein
MNARRFNSQPNNRDSNNVSVASFGSGDVSLSESRKNTGIRNGLMKMASSDWVETHATKFSASNQNNMLTKAMSYDAIENNLSWRSLNDLQPLQERIFYERLEQHVQNILVNYNKICPFSGKCKPNF